MRGKDDFPVEFVDKVKFYGELETPRDVIRFWCSGYKIDGSRIVIFDMLIDSSATRQSALIQKDVLYYDKVDIIGYMAMLFPYVPYKLRKGGKENGR